MKGSIIVFVIASLLCCSNSKEANKLLKDVIPDVLGNNIFYESFNEYINRKGINVPIDDFAKIESEYIQNRRKIEGEIIVVINNSLAPIEGLTKELVESIKCLIIETDTLDLSPFLNYIDTQFIDIEKLNYDNIKFYDIEGQYNGKSRIALYFSNVLFLENFTTAIFVLDYSCGRLCGETSLIVAHKKDSKWVIGETYVLAIS